MTTLYKRAGAGNWSAAGSWSLSDGGPADGTTPTAADDVRLTANSGNLTIDGTSGAPSLCRSFVCTGYTATLTHANTTALAVGDGTQGHFLLVSGMTYSPGLTSILRFSSTTTGNQITTAGKALGPITFDGVGGEWTLQDNLTTNNGNAGVSFFNHTAGTIITNDKTVTSSYRSTGTAVRALNLGSSTWSVFATSTVGWDLQDSTNFTLTAGSSTITMSPTSQNVSFNGAGLAYGTVSCTTLTTGSITINGANTFAALTLNCAAGSTAFYIFGADQTISGTFTANGNSLTQRTLYRSSVKGTQRTLTAATVSSEYSDWQDIVGAGAASWDLSAITGLSGDGGGNSGITFTTPQTNYWVPSGGTSTGNFNAVTRWATSSGGTAGTGRTPLLQDTARFDANSIDAGSRTITQSMARTGSIDFTGVTNNPAFAKPSVFTCYGSMTLGTLTNTGTVAITFEGRGSRTFSVNGVTWTNSLIFDCANGTYTLGSNLITSGSSNTLTSGTLDTDTYGLDFTGTFTNSAGTFINNGVSEIDAAISLSSSGTTTLNADFTAGGTFGIGNGAVLNINDATLTASNCTINGAGAGGDTTGIATLVGGGLAR